MAREIDVKIGQHIRACRKAKGLSQTYVADKLGITFQQVQKYERGLNRISCSTMIDLSKIIGHEVFECMISDVLSRQDVAIQPYIMGNIAKLSSKQQNALNVFVKSLIDG